MPPIRVLILGHSFIRRVHDFLCRNFNAHIAKNLSLDGDLLIRWHGIGGRTVSTTREYDLGIVEEFAPNVVIMQLGTNDLTTISAVKMRLHSGLYPLIHNREVPISTSVCLRSGRSSRPMATRIERLSDFVSVKY